ncbi:hypothetical protein NLJ89_g4359 [Agrocybe chaxingu]|uniref:Mediator of RNA polymerase II transcription subunit 20 n=1 Tax=Agrocybe chaxingu TaxID=84603 RepID=A0A9W8MWL4_9AGAR|nr:hypothetical protein NLJ89_g4359 [Agrocybe chaxingu]
MGFTGLARWLNAPASGQQLVRENLVLNHGAIPRGKWHISLKSYRSMLGQTLGYQVPIERTMYALTMEENVFILLEDPAAPSRADVLAAAPPGKEALFLQGPSHFRNTFLTLKPPGALEQLLAQIKARWVPVRQTTSSNNQRHQAGGQQLIIEGQVFSIGTDWVVRIGTVTLAGGAIKGMLLEAEYLPLPALHSSVADGTSELLSNLLTSILPNIPDAKTVAVTISDAQWEDVLWDREEEVKSLLQPADERVQDDNPYAWDNDDVKEWKRGDWTGVDRDQRSAYLIMGALRSEGLL